MNLRFLPYAREFVENEISESKVRGADPNDRSYMHSPLSTAQFFSNRAPHRWHIAELRNSSTMSIRQSLAIARMIFFRGQEPCRPLPKLPSPNITIHFTLLSLDFRISASFFLLILNSSASSVGRIWSITSPKTTNLAIPTRVFCRAINLRNR